MGATPQDLIDDGINVGDINFAITVSVKSWRSIFLITNCVNDAVHISNVHLTVIVHVVISDSIDIYKILPTLCVLILGYTALRNDKP